MYTLRNGKRNLCVHVTACVGSDRRVRTRHTTCDDLINDAFGVVVDMDDDGNSLWDDPLGPEERVPSPGTAETATPLGTVAVLGGLIFPWLFRFARVTCPVPPHNVCGRRVLSPTARASHASNHVWPAAAERVGERAGVRVW